MTGEWGKNLTKKALQCLSTDQCSKFLYARALSTCTSRFIAPYSHFDTTSVHQATEMKTPIATT